MVAVPVSSSNCQTRRHLKRLRESSSPLGCTTSKNLLSTGHDTAESRNSALHLQNAFQFTFEIHLVTHLNIDALHTHPGGRTLSLGQHNYVFNINGLHPSKLAGAPPSPNAANQPSANPLEKKPRMVLRPPTSAGLEIRPKHKKVPAPLFRKAHLSRLISLLLPDGPRKHQGGCWLWLDQARPTATVQKA